jgi:pimeloyl-ACP methyl ester carboxylesterase
MPITADIYYFAHQLEGSHLLPVVFIHGAGGSHLHWPAPMRRLKNYRVYALDLPAHGNSSGRGHQTIASYAQCILNWMDAIALDKVVFVGHSMGGAIALTLGLYHPERVLGLGLVATGARLKVAPDILELTNHQKSFPAAVEMITLWAFGPQSDARLVELASQRMLETPPTVLHSDFVACNAFDEISALSQINLPALVLCGQDDRLTPLRFSQYLADHIPTARLKAIPDAGHMVMLEKPLAVTRALVEFIAAIPY